MTAETDAARLLSQGERLAALQETLSARFARELATTLRDLERRLRAWAEQPDSASQTQAARLAVLRQDVQALLRGAGFQALIDDASAAATDRLLAQIEPASLEAAGRLAVTDYARIAALRAGFLAAVLPTDEELIVPLLRTVLYAVLGGASRRDLIAILAETMDREARHMTTLYDTALSTYTRQVQDLKRDPAPEALLLYSGPVDTRLRPFCAARVGKVYTRADVQAMDNGQLPNPLLTGGGYNCRHVWMTVPAGSALAALAGTDERAPGVAADLRGLGGQRAA